jgi:endonuclease/exonuclease/phosphatase family metal-dependent hydrolase
VVAVPGGPAVTVVSVHLGLDPAERVRQARMVLDQLPAIGPAPYVIAGDLNEPPGGPGWEVLGALVQDVAPTGEPTFPARAPRRRIDGVLASAGMVVHSARVVGAADGADPDDLVAASDHLPVVADLVVRSGLPVDS